MEYEIAYSPIRFDVVVVVAVVPFEHIVCIFDANSIRNADDNVPFLFQLSLIEFELFTFSPHVDFI